MHPFVEKIKNILNKNKIKFNFFIHKEVITSEQASAVRDEYNLSQGIKALIIKYYDNDKKKFLMVCVPGDKKINNKKLRTVLNIKKYSLVKLDELEIITQGVKRGGIPPLAFLFNLDAIADNKILKNENIIFNCGDRRASIAIKSSDFKFISEAKFFDITE